MFWHNLQSQLAFLFAWAPQQTEEVENRLAVCYTLLQRQGGGTQERPAASFRLLKEQLIPDTELFLGGS